MTKKKKQTAAEKKRATSRKASTRKRQAAKKAQEQEIIQFADEEIPDVETKLVKGLEAEPPAPQELVPAAEEDSDLDLELSPVFQKAVIAAMDLFAQFIVYEKDAPEEARIMIFPAFMHITPQAINAEIVSMYTPGVEAGPGAEAGPAKLEDLKIINEGIQDSISILKLRTEGSFPSPGQRALNQLEYEALSDLAATETRLFYRISEEDLLRGHIRLSSTDAIRANQPKGTRIRTWVSVQAFTKLFYTVLADDSVEDMVTALIQEDMMKGAGYARYLRRWREAELI